MEISSILSESVIDVELKAVEKKEVLEELLDLLIKNGKVKKSHKNDIITSLMEREKLGSTGIGQGIGIPHAKTKYVNELIAAFGLSKDGVNFNALDGNKVKIIFLLLAPENITGPHLKALASISRILRDRLIREKLLSCKNSKNIMSFLIKQEGKAS